MLIPMLRHRNLGVPGASTARRFPIAVGTLLSAPTPVFRKLDPSIVDEELARLEAEAAR